MPGPLKSFVDLLGATSMLRVWCCFAAMYKQGLSAAGVGISGYQYFHSEKGMY